MKLESIALHSGYTAEATTNAAAVPIYQTTSYTFNDTQHGADLFNLAVPGNIYTRIMNPTTAVLEQRMADMEGGIGALAVASGMAAITYAIECIAGTGDNIVSTSQLYGGTYNFFAHSLPRQGIETRFFVADDFDALEKAIDDDGCLSYQEIHDLVAAVVGDGQVTPQELRDMQAIATHSKSLQGPGKIYLQAFLANPQAFIDHNRMATEGSSGGSEPTSNGSNGATPPSNAGQSPTQQANTEFYRRHPHRKGKLLTSSAADRPYRTEWMDLYRSFGGT